MSRSPEDHEDCMIKEHNNQGNDNNNVFTKKIMNAKAQIHKDISILVTLGKSTSHNGQRNVLNKWFQDSVKNYFLEVFAAPLILEDLRMNTVDQVKNYIHQTVLTNDAKFMQLINQYYQEMNRFRKLSQFKTSLEELVLSSLKESSGPLNLSYLSYTRQKTIRKQFVGLLLLMFCFCKEQNKEITSFYDLWNEAFPEDLKYKKKLSKYDTIRIQKSNQKDQNTKHITRRNLQSEKACNSKKSDNKNNNLAFSNERDKLNHSLPKSKFSLEGETQILAAQQIDMSSQNFSKQIPCSYRYLDSNPFKCNISTSTPKNIKVLEKSQKTDNSQLDSNSQGESASSTVIAFRSVIDVAPSSQFIHKDLQDLENIQYPCFNHKYSKIYKKIVQKSSKNASPSTPSPPLSPSPSSFSSRLNQNSQPPHLGKRQCLTYQISIPNKKIKVNQLIIQGKSEQQLNQESPPLSQQISQQQQSQDLLESLKISVYQQDHNQINQIPFHSKSFSGNQTDNQIQFMNYSLTSQEQMQFSVSSRNSVYYQIQSNNNINEAPNQIPISFLSTQLPNLTNSHVKQAQEQQLQPCLFLFPGSQGLNTNLNSHQYQYFNILGGSQNMITCQQMNAGQINFKI